MDTSAQWPQEIVVKTIEEIVTNTYPKAATLEKKTTREAQKEQALNCPRCNSTNPKFCYYNNYSLTQPRYFCKTCRRYWTEGGSLRNIPVGGGSRKNKRPSSSDSPSSSSKNPKIHEAQDLNLAFKANATRGYTSHVSEFVQLPNNNNNNNVEINNKNNQIPNSSSSSSLTSQLSAMELLNGISSRGLNSFSCFIPMPVSDPSTVYTSGFPMHDDFKPILNFSLDGLGNGTAYGSLQGVQETTNGSVLFLSEDPKQATNTTDNEQNKEQGDSAGYWSGMLGGRSW